MNVLKMMVLGVMVFPVFGVYASEKENEKINKQVEVKELTNFWNWFTITKLIRKNGNIKETNLVSSTFMLAGVVLAGCFLRY